MPILCKINNIEKGYHFLEYYCNDWILNDLGTVDLLTSKFGYRKRMDDRKVSNHFLISILQIFDQNSVIERQK